MDSLTLYKSQIDANVGTFCNTLLERTEKEFGPYSREAIETYCSLLSRGGKRIRGSLLMAAYHMAGGKDTQLATNVARIIEMLNSNLLIFDDIADLSDKRRGGPTVHRMFERYHHDAKLYGGSEHFGVAMALHVGLAGTYLVAAELGQIDAPSDIKLALSKNLNRAIYTTIHGQFNDIANEAVRLVNERQVERTLTWKAAYYTLLQPMQAGLLLAGVKDVDIPAVREYALHLGLAYQIIDDILGTFGDETKSGKSAREDLMEGKITLLVSRALQHGNAEQKKALLAALGNKKLTDAGYAQAKAIMRDTGAFDYARDTAAIHAQAATRALESAPKDWSKEGVQFLRDLAQYITTRQK